MGERIAATPADGPNVLDNAAQHIHKSERVNEAQHADWTNFFISRERKKLRLVIFDVKFSVFEVRF